MIKTFEQSLKTLIPIKIKKNQGKMEKLYAIHTNEPDPKNRRLMVVRVTEDKLAVLLSNVGMGSAQVKEIQPSDLEKIMDQYGVPK